MYSGTDIFKLVDTHGLPLDVINMMLREKNTFFNCPEFIEAAKKAGWQDVRIFHTLVGASPLQGEALEALKFKIGEILAAT